MRWANENPEAMAEIASLPPSEQNEALRAAMIGQLSRSPRPLDDQDLERTCRNCGAEFLVPDRMANSQSKWTNLCPSCLMDEL